VARYLILGAGKFGALARQRLARQEAAASLVMVDREAAVLAALGDRHPGVHLVQAEAVAYLVEHLKPGCPWDWIIPMVPGHVIYGWLVAGPLAGSGWQPVVAPEGLTQLAAEARRGPAGELYLSRARHLCPDDCAEPEVCPVSGEPRPTGLHQDLASFPAADYRIKVVASEQLAPGVGGYPPGRLLALARELKDLRGTVVIATACRCHGVVQALKRQ
jgi:hypothetical protein